MGLLWAATVPSTLVIKPQRCSVLKQSVVQMLLENRHSPWVSPIGPLRSLRSSHPYISSEHHELHCTWLHFLIPELYCPGAEMNLYLLSLPCLLGHPLSLLRHSLDILCFSITEAVDSSNDYAWRQNLNYPNQPALRLAGMWCCHSELVIYNLPWIEFSSSCSDRTTCRLCPTSCQEALWPSVANAKWLESW